MYGITAEQEAHRQLHLDRQPNVVQHRWSKFRCKIIRAERAASYADHSGGHGNLPGGAWDESPDHDHEGHHGLAGDPILRDIDYRRYLAFYYCNATALASSLVVCLILVMLPKKHKVWTVVLRAVMVLDLLGLMGSYVAGSCRDAFTTISALVLASPILTYITYGFWCYLRGFFLLLLSCIGCKKDADAPTNTVQEEDATTTNAVQEDATPTVTGKEVKIQVLMPLATFAATITYAAGLNPPGGFWSSSSTNNNLVHEQQHVAGDPMMQDSGPRRYRAFFVCNTTGFVASLLVILLLLLDKKLIKTITGWFTAVYVFIDVALLGLIGAYAAGSCREVDNTLKVLSLIVVVPACVGLQKAISYVSRCQGVEHIISGNSFMRMRAAVSKWFINLIPKGSRPEQQQRERETRYFIMVLASLAVGITYQAGLDPPGGLWQDDRDRHKAGHPVLRTTHPARYGVFFYSNSAAFVTSLVVVTMVQTRLKRRTLVAAMVLDLIGLIVAYAAGSTRDASTSIYVVAIACLLLSYSVIHISVGREKEKSPPPDNAAAVVATATPAEKPGRTKEQLEDKRQVLLLIAILATALTYQAGLTPPGGFWPEDDDQLGHRAGYPVLLDNYPRRYKAFFYCNAASFMASVALVILLMNRKLYNPGVRSYALHACMAVGMIALMGAYASGSSRQLKTSIYVLTLVAGVSASILLQVVIFWYIRQCTQDPAKSERRKLARGRGGQDEEKDEELEYLMLLGVLIATVTYQTGLKPPGGIWQKDNNVGDRHYSAGNQILHDISQRRYNVFFYSNSASFMASIIVIVMLLPFAMTVVPRNDPKWLLWPVHTSILMDMLALLVAYAAGSTRKWESFRNVIFLILPVLAYIVVYTAVLSVIHIPKNQGNNPESSSVEQGQSA